MFDRKMTISDCIEQLERFNLIQDYESNKLTFLKLAYSLNLNFGWVQKSLLDLGYPKYITNTTTVDLKWMTVIFDLKVIKHLGLDKHKNEIKKKRKVRMEPPPLNKILRHNWEKRKNEENEAKRSPHAKIISIPMGGKVRKARLSDHIWPV